MDLLEVGKLLLAALSGAGSLITYLYTTGRLAGRESGKVTVRLAHVEKILARASAKMSHRWSRIQTIVGTVEILRTGGQQLRRDVSRLQEQVADLRVDVARLQGTPPPNGLFRP